MTLRQQPLSGDFQKYVPEIKEGALVIKSNKLITGSYKLSPLQKKLFGLVIAEIEMNDPDFKTYVFPIKVLLDELSLGEDNHSYLWNSARELRKKEIYIKTSKAEISVGFFSKVQKNLGDSTIEFLFDPALKPYLLQLKKNFTKTEFKIIVNFKNYNSIRIYEYIKMYENLNMPNGIRLPVEDLLKMLGLDKKKTYNDFSHVRKKIIELALSEINSISDINVSYDVEKLGRKVIAVIFKVNKKAKALEKVNLSSIAIWLKNNGTKTKEIDLLNRLHAIAGKYGEDVVVKWFDEVQKSNNPHPAQFWKKWENAKQKAKKQNFNDSSVNVPAEESKTLTEEEREKAKQVFDEIKKNRKK